MKNPSILIICPFYPPNLGGVETHLALLTEYLYSKAYDVSVLTYKPLTTKASYLPFEKKGNLEVRRFWWFGFGWFDKLTPYPFFQFLYIVPGLLFCSLLWMLNSPKQFDVIHAHGFAAAFVARVLGLFRPIKRTVVSTHFIYRKLQRNSLSGRLFNWVFSGFDKILLISKGSGRELTDLGLDKKRMIVFHHWLNLYSIVPQTKKVSRLKTGLPLNAKLMVLFIGRIIRMKGVFELLETAKRLPSDIKIIVVGSGPDFETLNKTASGVKNFLIVGRKSHEEVFNYLHACDFLILPSLNEEAQPMVVMESLTCGCPVVVTTKGSVKEMITPSIGKVINPDVNSIYNTILQFYYHPDKLRKMARLTKPFARRHFSLENAKLITKSYSD